MNKSLCIDDLLDELKQLVQGRKIVNSKGRPFYGDIVVVQVQDGKLRTCRVNQSHHESVAFITRETLKFD